MREDARRDDDARQFAALRPLLFSLAYGIVESAAECDLLLDEVEFIWAQPAGAAAVDGVEEHLVRLVIQKALTIVDLDESRQMPIAEHKPKAKPPQLAPATDFSTLADEAVGTMLARLQTLQPEERAVFLLQRLFQHDVDDVASMTGRTPESVHQLALRAREQMNGPI
ncbi:hypothetical protein GCM10023339_76690 [Alloalcanivorax gelatiniphagus]